MKKICCYCKCDMDSSTEPAKADGLISHGICRKCLDVAMAGLGEPLEEYLDTLHVPVLLVDNNVRILIANSPAKALLSLIGSKEKGLLGGEAFRCKWHKLPEGCGKTIHCKTCTIRNTVAWTFETGERCTEVPACLDLDVIAGPRRACLVISTERVNNVVFVRIDDFQ